MYSSAAAMKTPATPRNASKIRNAIIQPRIVVVTEAPEVAVHWCVRSLENARFSGRASVEYSQPRVSSSYGVAWRYHQVTPQVRRAQNVMPVELLTFLLAR